MLLSLWNMIDHWILPFPTPSYYRPASSVTLTCILYDAIGSVQYQWTSSQNLSFVHNKTDSVIIQRLLTSSDAGIQTCIVTDMFGNTGAAKTEMELFGKQK